MEAGRHWETEKFKKGDNQNQQLITFWKNIECTSKNLESFKDFHRVTKLIAKHSVVGTLENAKMFHTK